MSKTTVNNLDDRQCEMPDVATILEQAGDSVRNAESCETPEDFDANLDATADSLQEALDAIKTIRTITAS